MATQDLLNPKPLDMTLGGPVGRSAQVHSANAGSGAPGEPPRIDLPPMVALPAGERTLMAQQGANPQGAAPARPGELASQGADPVPAEPMTGDLSGEEWMRLANESDRSSANLFSTELVDRWDRSLRAFMNKHQRGSKYESKEYQQRSRLFRPKTRATVRRNEAAAAEAFFANREAVRITATDEGDLLQTRAAKFIDALMNDHLNESIKWFLTLQGAAQVVQTQGIVSSWQSWDYAERKVMRFKPMIDPGTGRPIYEGESGEPALYEVPDIDVLRDRPRIDLIAGEHLRIDPGADWTDPAQSSPYVFVYVPMFFNDVLAMMNTPDPKTGAPPWKQVAPELILGTQSISAQHQAQQVRQSREQRGAGADDPKQRQQNPREYQVVWPRRNILRRDGQDYYFWSIGDRALLTDPKPIEEVFPALDGERPLVIGYYNLEAFKVYPMSPVEAVQPVQQSLNDLHNLRLDQTRLNIIGRVKVKRGKDFDLTAWTNALPGGVVYVDGMDDIEHDKPQGMPREAFEEQDRLNADFDDVAGAFNNSSVITNRGLNETVGGMQLLSNSANIVQRYDLRIFTETWVTPTLRQTMANIKHYETDQERLTRAARRADLDGPALMQIAETYGIDPESVIDTVLAQKQNLKVQVGVGNLDPVAKMQNLDTAASALSKTFGEERVGQKLNFDEYAKEVFGVAGFADGERFIIEDESEDPQIEALKQALQEATQEIEKLKAGNETKERVAAIAAMGRVAAEEKRGEAQVLAAAQKDMDQQPEGETEVIDAILQRIEQGGFPDAPPPPPPEAFASPAPQGGPQPGGPPGAGGPGAGGGPPSPGMEQPMPPPGAMPPGMMPGAMMPPEQMGAP